MAPFACTGCGDCCRGFGREKPDWEPQRGPVLRLSDEPGLPLMSWEAQRFRALGAERGVALDLQAFDGVLDARHRRIVVLSYRMAALQCPFLASRDDLAAGPRSEAWGFARGGTCTVYGHRPLACRAYPLVPLRNGVALSLHCPELVDVDIADPASLATAYGSSARDAEAFRAAPALAAELVRGLVARGVLDVVPEAQGLAAEARASWPRVDLCELAAEHGLGAWETWERRARS